MSVSRVEHSARWRSPAGEPARGALDGFEARLRPASSLRWPRGERLGPDEAIELGPSDTDLVLMHRSAADRAARGGAHDSLLIELGVALHACRPGLLPLRRIVFRSGNERVTYQATRATGSVALVATSAERYVLSVTLSLLAPDLDLDGLGPFLLAGTVHLPRA